MAFFDRFSQRDTRVDLSLALRVEGIPFVFVERTHAGATFGLPGSVFTQLVVVAEDGFTEGETSVDLDERREKGATLDVSLIDDDARTLRALFATNARRKGWITQDFDASISTLTVNSNTIAAAGSTVYIGSETIILGAVFGLSTYTSCVRGAFGSTASPLYGLSVDGDSVYSSVPAWRGRRAYLYGYTSDDNGGEFEELLSTWLVDESPSNDGDLRWRLRLGGLAHEYYSRALYVGVQTAKSVGPTAHAVSAGIRRTSTQVDVPRNLAVGANWPTYAIVESEENRNMGTDDAPELETVTASTIHEVLFVDTLLGGVTVSTDPSFGVDPMLARIKTLRPLLAAGGTIGAAVLYPLMSRLGDGVASTYDRLVGRDGISIYDGGWSLGAKFTANEIDIASFTAISPAAWALCVAREIEVGALLTEYGILSGCITRINRLGQLTLVPLAERVTSTFIIDASTVDPSVEPSVFHDETALTPLLTASTNYDPVLDDFAATFNFTDVDLLKRYPRDPQRRSIELFTQSIDLSTARAAAISPYTKFRPAVTVDAGAIANTIVRDVQRGDGGAGRRYVSLAVTFAGLTVRVGDVLRIGTDLPEGFAGLPDFEGGTIAGKTARVIGRRPDWREGLVRLRLQIIDSALVVCPAATITAIVGTTITLSTVEIEVSDGGNPQGDFYAGASVRIYDRSALIAGGAPVVAFATVLAILSAPPRLQLSAAPPFAIQVGVDYVVLDPKTTTTNSSNSKGFALTDMATLADGDGVGVDGAGNVTEPRWR